MRMSSTSSRQESKASFNVLLRRLRGSSSSKEAECGQSPGRLTRSTSMRSMKSTGSSGSSHVPATDKSKRRPTSVSGRLFGGLSKLKAAVTSCSSCQVHTHRRDRSASGEPPCGGGFGSPPPSLSPRAPSSTEDHQPTCDGCGASQAQPEVIRDVLQVHERSANSSCETSSCGSLEHVASQDVTAVGCSLRVGRPSGCVHICKVEKGTWAYRVGLKDGDEVEMLNGNHVGGLTAVELQEQLQRRPLHVRLARPPELASTRKPAESLSAIREHRKDPSPNCEALGCGGFRDLLRFSVASVAPTPSVKDNVEKDDAQTSSCASTDQPKDSRTPRSDHAMQRYRCNPSACNACSTCVDDPVTLLRKMLQAPVAGSLALASLSPEAAGSEGPGDQAPQTPQKPGRGQGSAASTKAIAGQPPLVISGNAYVRQSLEGEPVWLHIYDVFGALERVNSVMKPVGTGAFHAGVEVFGKEWSYGYAIQGNSGVYHCKPRCNDRHRYRESVAMGGTCMTEIEVASLIQEMRSAWVGVEYELLTKNCCHFSDALCRRLGVGPAPEWLMHLAGAGVLLVNGVEKAVMHTHTAVTLAAEKAGELDDHYQFSERAGQFLSREVNIDEDYLGARAQEVLEKALEHLAPVGELAERVIDEAMKPMSPTQMEQLWTHPRASLLVSPGALFRWWPQANAAQESNLPALANGRSTDLPTVAEAASPESAETQRAEIEEIQDLQDLDSLPANVNAWHGLVRDIEIAQFSSPVADERQPAGMVETSAATAATATAEAATAEAATAPPEVLSPLTTFSERPWLLPSPGTASGTEDRSNVASRQWAEDESTPLGSTVTDAVAAEDSLEHKGSDNKQPDEDRDQNVGVLEDKRNVPGKEMQWVQDEHDNDSSSNDASPRTVGAYPSPVPVLRLESDDSGGHATCRV